MCTQRVELNVTYSQPLTPLTTPYLLSSIQPRHNVIGWNLCRELGVWEKQSSFYTQFKSSENTIVGNIVFNGPRAHVNFNDGERVARGSVFIAI